MASNKVDKGFEFFYYKLSYRRRFIRTLCLMPIGIIISVWIFLQGDALFINRILPITIIIGYPIQLIYNYKKWKENENR